MKVKAFSAKTPQPLWSATSSEAEPAPWGGVTTSSVFASTTVTLAVSGTNDAPVALAVAANVAEDAAVLNGAVSATDIDGNAVLLFALTGAAPAGLSFNPNGSYAVDPSHAAYKSLAVGQSHVLTLTKKLSVEIRARATGVGAGLELDEHDVRHVQAEILRHQVVETAREHHGARQQQNRERRLHEQHGGQGLRASDARAANVGAELREIRDGGHDECDERRERRHRQR